MYYNKTRKHINIIDYRDFHKLPTNSDFILYYPSSYTENGLSGHYIAVINKPHIIYYYDSYGFVPNYIKHYKFTDINLYNEMRSNFITELLKCGKTIDYNNYKHQDNNSSTCGRHCLMRILKNDLDTEQYNKFITKNKIKPDDIVSIVFH